jgi:hypothetical protein
MKHMTSVKLLLVVMAAALILGACNLPLTGGNISSEAMAQTMSAQTLAVFMGQYLTQTAQAVPNVIYVTATSQPTNTSLPATSTNTPEPTKTPTKTPIPIPCNLAAFVDDITVDDGTSFVAGTGFVKTWRIKNIGTCTWGSGYKLYFSKGDSMSGSASVDLPKSVAPGGTVDVSVSLIAPSDPDEYVGEWMLRSANGEQFGVGTGGYAPLTVEIKVSKIPKPFDDNTVYDFVGKYCDAEWRTNAGFIDCPSSSIGYTNGTISRTYAPILENGVKDNEGALITIPAKGGDGMIQGQYPKFLVHSGDHIKGLLLCTYQKEDCSVKFEILAKEYGSSSVTSLGSWEKDYDKSNISIDIDLSSMDGKQMIFFLKVYSMGNPTDDFAQWMAIRITHP